jgi:hypothetical protein
MRSGSMRRARRVGRRLAGGTPGPLRARPVAIIAELASRSAPSFPTVAKAIEALTEVGITRELAGGRRNRVFAYDRYLAILSEGTEPL